MTKLRKFLMGARENECQSSQNYIFHMKFSEFYVSFHNSCEIWHSFSRTPTQVAQVSNMSISKHRHCCITFKTIRICIAKKTIVSVTYENETISTKNSLPYLKCVLRLSCIVHGLIYGHFVGFYVNCFLSIFKVYQGTPAKWPEGSTKGKLL